jgi:hypothetical protein
MSSCGPAQLDPPTLIRRHRETRNDEHHDPLRLLLDGVSGLCLGPDQYCHTEHAPRHDGLLGHRPCPDGHDRHGREPSPEQGPRRVRHAVRRGSLEREALSPVRRSEGSLFLWCPAESPTCGPSALAPNRMGPGDGAPMRLLLGLLISLLEFPRPVEVAQGKCVDDGLICRRGLGIKSVGVA